MTTLSVRIRERREALDLSQAELAQMLGYSDRSTIAKIEKGVNDITQSKIAAFAEALHTTPAYLMGWTDDYYDYDTDEDNRLTTIPSAQFKHLKEIYNDDLEKMWHAWELIQSEIYDGQDSSLPVAIKISKIDNQEPSKSRDQLLILARHLDKIPEESRNRLVKNFSDTIDDYLNFMGISKEEED